MTRMPPAGQAPGPAAGGLLGELRRLGGERALGAGVAAAFTVKVTAIATVFLVQLALVRMLGADAYGDYVYAFSWFTAVLPFSALGIQNAALRFVPEYRAAGSFGRLRGFLLSASGLALAAPALVAAAGAAVTLLLGDRLRPELALCFLIAWAMLPIAALGSVHETALRAVRRIIQGQGPPEVLRPALLAAGVFAAVVLGGRAATGGVAMASALAATAATVALSIGLVAKALGPELAGVAARYRMREWLDLALHMMGLTVVLAIMYKVDVLMLGALVGTREAGIYGLAVQITAVVPFSLHTLNVVTVPLIAERHSRGRLDELARILKLGARVTTAIAAALAIGLAVAGRPFLALYDPAFVAGYAPLVTLAVGQLAYVAVGPSVFVLALTGRQRLAVVIAIAGAVLNTALNAALIPLFGMTGAGFATAASIAVWSGLNLYFARARLGVDASVF